MKLSNATLIALINGIGTIQEVDFPVSASFELSQNTEALLDAYTFLEVGMFVSRGL